MGDVDSEGGGGVRGGHTNRHSWDPETAQQYQGITVGSFTRGSGDKIERSQSARFDRVATDTNNRFERLNPDAEAPGDQPTKPNLVAGGGGRGRKRNSRSVSGTSSSYRSKSPKRRSGKEVPPRGGEREREREKEGVAPVSCELEWDSGTQSGEQEPSSDVVNGGSSPGKESLAKQTSVELFSSADSKTSGGASAQGEEGAEIDDSDGAACGSNSEETEELERDKCEETGAKKRITYTRVRPTHTHTHTVTCSRTKLACVLYVHTACT